MDWGKLAASGIPLTLPAGGPGSVPIGNAPKDSNGEGGRLGAEQHGLGGIASTRQSGGGVDRSSPWRIFIGHLPKELEEDALNELLSVFGVLKSLHIGRGPDKAHRGFAHVEFVDSSITDSVIAALNGLEVIPGKGVLHVSRAKPATASATTTTSTPVSGMVTAAPVLPYPPATALGVGGGALDPNLAAFLLAQQQQSLPLTTVATSAQMMGATPTSFTDPAIAGVITGRVVVLEHMLEVKDLVDDAEFRDIKDDIQQECEKYGKVNIKVSRHHVFYHSHARLRARARAHTHTHTHAHTTQHKTPLHLFHSHTPSRPWF